LGGTSADAQSRRGGGLVRALIAAGIAAAIGKGGAAKPGEKDYGDRVLRPAELKSCLIAAHRLDLQDEELDFQKTQIDVEGDSLATTRGQLNRDSQIPVASQIELDEVNQRIDMFNARVSSQKYTTELYNQRLRKHSNEVDGWNQTCGGHKFFLYDLDNMKADLPFNIEQYIKRES
jgi:hypothetical protein